MTIINTMLNTVRSGLILLLLLIADSTASANEKIQLLSSIRPLDLLVSELTDHEINHSVLMNAQQSPHHLQLKPSQRQRLQDATSVYWFGDELEPMIATILSGDDSLSRRAINLRPTLQAMKNNHDEHHHHDHHTNVHYWLDRENVIKAAGIISANIATLLPEKADQINGKVKQLNKDLMQLEKILEHELRSARAKRYLDLHNAWQLLAEDFNLPAFSSIEHQSLEFSGAKTVLSLRRDIASGKYDCVIASPETNLRLVNNLAENSNTNILLLDALGNDLENESGFTDFLIHNIKKLAAC